MGIEEMMSSDAGLSLVGGVVGMAWTFFKSQGWFAKRRHRRYMRAVQALEAGVDMTYREYVRALKQGRNDGKLTDKEIRMARNRAKAAALEFGHTTGVDVIRELGSNYLDLWISRTVQKLQGSGRRA